MSSALKVWLDKDYKARIDRKIRDSEEIKKEFRKALEEDKELRVQAVAELARLNAINSHCNDQLINRDVVAHYYRETLLAVL